MRASRGMGAINADKMPKGKKILRKDALEPVEIYKEGGAVWNKPRPSNLGAPKPLSPAKKAQAKARAKAAGRPYPNLVDNMRMAKNG